MAVLTLHHWDNNQERGVREMRRVARGPVVLITYDATVSNRMWLMADYLEEVAELDARIFPPPATVVEWLGGSEHAVVSPLLIPRHCRDQMLGAFWAHPEWVLDAAIRDATSGFARQTPTVVARVVANVARDLESGAWDTRYGHLRQLDEFDAGLRLIVAG
jgi:hypothetical protein